MEESDAMLITSIKDLITIPEDIATLRDIRTEHIFDIGCNAFQALKIDYSQLKQISRAQRFRCMTKLTQTINHEMDTNFNLNDIMNPTLPFLRKLLLAFISKLGAAESERNKAIITQKVEGGQARYQKEMYKKWINNQYICPALRTTQKVKYQSHLLKIQFKKEIFKRNLVSELSSMPMNAKAIIKTTIAKQTMERKKREAEEGITRKAEQNTRNVYKITKNNAEDWEKADNVTKKLKKQLIKAEESASSAAEQKPTELSIYQMEVTKIADEQKKLKGVDDKRVETRASQVQSTQSEMSPFERIKIEAENTRIQLQKQLNFLLNAISEAKQEIEQKEILKQKLQDQIVLYQQRAKSEIESRVQLKKKVQKQKIMLDSIEGDTDISKQVDQMEKQLKFLEQEAEKQISGLQKEIANTKKEGEQKLEILKDLKLRLNKIENDYGKISEEIDEKTEIKGKVKITKSGISRLYYSKKISEMEARWRETQKESKKIKQNVTKIRQDIRRTIYLTEIGQTEIENSANTSKLRSEAENLSFKQIFNQCKKTFTHTIKCIEEINETKNEIQEYQMKVHTLAGKDYKQNTKKLELALEELKKEIKQAAGKK